MTFSFYDDVGRNRILRSDGVSLFSDVDMLERILTKKSIEKCAVLESRDSKLYDMMFTAITLTEQVPENLSVMQHDQEDVDLLLELIVESNRYVPTQHKERVLEELEFFERTDNILFILKTKNLIEKFKESGILWGVGRGSSCASVVCYILEITDVDPTQYNISFSELSKE